MLESVDLLEIKKAQPEKKLLLCLFAQFFFCFQNNFFCYNLWNDPNFVSGSYDSSLQLEFAKLIEIRELFQQNCSFLQARNHRPTKVQSKKNIKFLAFAKKTSASSTGRVCTRTCLSCSTSIDSDHSREHSFRSSSTELCGWGIHTTAHPETNFHFELICSKSNSFCCMLVCFTPLSNAL